MEEETVLPENDVNNPQSKTLRVMIIDPETNQKLLDARSESIIISCVVPQDNQVKNINFFNGNIEVILGLLHMVEHEATRQYQQFIAQKGKN